jgi:glutamine synthetase
MTKEELLETPKTPGSLEEAIAALEKDHDFLLAGDVFTPDLIAAWITWKKEKELDEMHLRPHPYEFHLYYDS